MESDEAVVEQLYKQGQVAYRRGNFSEAFDLWAKAKSICLQNGNEVVAAFCSLNIGAALRSLSKPREALEQYKLAESAFLQLGLKKESAVCKENIGKAMCDLEEARQAIIYFEEAGGIFLSLGLEEEAANCELYIGIVLFNQGLNEHKAGNTRQAFELWSGAKGFFLNTGFRKGLADCDRNISVALVKFGQLDQAIAFYESAKSMYLRLELQSEANDCDMIVGSALFVQGLHIHRIGQIDKAIEFWEQAKTLFQQQGSEKEIAGCELNIGATLCDFGSPKQAIEHLEAAKKIFLRLRCEKEAADCDVDIGNALGALGQVQSAIDYYQRAGEVFYRLGFDKEYASSIRNLGATLVQLRQLEQAQPEQAREHLERAKAIFLRLGMTIDVASCDAGLGGAFYLANEFRRAIEHFELAKETYQNFDHQGEVAQCDMGIGGSLEDLGEFNQALEYLERAKETFFAIGLEERGATACVNIGVTLCSAGQPHKAIAYGQQARNIFLRYGLQAETADCESNIGTAFGELGQPQQAIDYFEQARMRYRQLDLPIKVSDCDVNIAIALNILVQPHQALKMFQEARQIYLQYGLDEKIVRCDMNIGNILIKLRQPEQAIRCFEEAINFSMRFSLRKQAADCMLGLGSACMILSHPHPQLFRPGSINQAIEHYERAKEIYLELGLDKDVAGADGNIGIALDTLGQRTRAIEHFEAAKTIYHELGFENKVADYEMNIGFVLDSIARDSAGESACIRHQAISHLDKAITIFEKLRADVTVVENRMSFFKHYANSYQTATECLIKLGRVKDALHYLERSRSKVLAEMVSGNLVPDQNEIGEELYTEFLNLRARLHQLGLLPTVKNMFDSKPESEGSGSERRQAQQDFDSLVQRIAREFPDSTFTRRLAATEVRYLKDVDEYVDLLPNGRSCLLEFLTWADDGRMRAFLVTRQKRIELLVFPQGSLARLDEIWQQWQKMYIGQLRQAEKEDIVWTTCHQLHEMIFNAEIDVIRESDGQSASTETHRFRLLDYLDTTLEQGTNGQPRRMYLIPHAQLFFMPLHAACYSSNGSRPRYLLEDYAVIYAPSAYLLKVSKEREYREPAQPRAMVVGNPKPHTKPLPGMKEEAEEAAKRLMEAGWRVDSLIEERATKQRYLHGDGQGVLGIHQGAYSHQHLAQHASFGANGQQAGLDFAENQVCYTGDIVGAPLQNTASVIAAACFTSTTDLSGQAINEYLGLGASFLQAGAGTFIGSLYELSDEGSKQIMSDLYRLRLQEGLSWAGALRTAQLALLRKNDFSNSTPRRAGATATSESLGNEPPPDSFQHIEKDTEPLTHPYHWAALTVSGKE